MALKEHDANGSVIPACWIPGEDTIEPTVDNTGKMWANYKGILENEKRHV
jgi:alkyl hydroperoxide reductase subunit AhpC